METVEARLAFIAGCQAAACCNACRTMAADTLALLRSAAAEPEAKAIDPLNVTPASRSTLCQACGKSTVCLACVVVDGFLYHQECFDRRLP